MEGFRSLEGSGRFPTTSLSHLAWWRNSNRSKVPDNGCIVQQPDRSGKCCSQTSQGEAAPVRAQEGCPGASTEWRRPQVLRPRVQLEKLKDHLSTFLPPKQGPQDKHYGLLWDQFSSVVNVCLNLEMEGTIHINRKKKSHAHFNFFRKSKYNIHL